MNYKVGQLKEELQEKKNDLDVKMKLLENKTSEIQIFKKDIEAEKMHNLELSSKLASTEFELGKVKKEINSLKAEKGKMEESMVNFNGMIDDLVGQVKSKEGTQGELGQQAERNKMLALEYKQDGIKKTEEIRGLKLEITRLNDEIVVLRAELEEINKEKDVLNQNYEDLQNDCERLIRTSREKREQLQQRIDQYQLALQAQELVGSNKSLDFEKKDDNRLKELEELERRLIEQKKEERIRKEEKMIQNVHSEMDIVIKKGKKGAFTNDLKKVIMSKPEIEDGREDTHRVRSDSDRINSKKRNKTENSKNNASNYDTKNKTIIDTKNKTTTDAKNRTIIDNKNKTMIEQGNKTLRDYNDKNDKNDDRNNMINEENMEKSEMEIKRSQFKRGVEKGMVRSMINVNNETGRKEKDEGGDKTGRAEKKERKWEEINSMKKEKSERKIQNTEKKNDDQNNRKQENQSKTVVENEKKPETSEKKPEKRPESIEKRQGSPSRKPENTEIPPKKLENPIKKQPEIQEKKPENPIKKQPENQEKKPENPIKKPENQEKKSEKIPEISNPAALPLKTPENLPLKPDPSSKDLPIKKPPSLHQPVKIPTETISKPPILAPIIDDSKTKKSINDKPTSNSMISEFRSENTKFKSPIVSPKHAEKEKDAQFLIEKEKIIKENEKNKNIIEELERKLEEILKEKDSLLARLSYIEEGSKVKSTRTFEKIVQTSFYEEKTAPKKQKNVILKDLGFFDDKPAVSNNGYPISSKFAFENIRSAENLLTGMNFSKLKEVAGLEKDRKMEEIYGLLQKTIDTGDNTNPAGGLLGFEGFVKDKKQLKFEEFQEMMGKVIEEHRKCGPKCGHLKRFYDRLGFVEGKMNRTVFKIHRRDLSRLPKIGSATEQPSI